MNRPKDPKFPGFPPAALRFLSGLKRHNNREWFQKNKHIYDQEIRRPMEELIDVLATDLQQIAPDMVVSRRVSIFRIYRDTRFSNDKTPYKTHASATFPPKGLGKHEGAGLYFHFSPTELLIGGGLYMPQSDDLRSVREHIAENVDSFKDVLRRRSFRQVYGELAGDQLTRTPRGFAVDHPAAAYLRYKQFLAMKIMPGEVAATTQFYPTLLECFRALHPLVAFLNEPILQKRKLKERQESLLARA